MCSKSYYIPNILRKHSIKNSANNSSCHFRDQGLVWQIEVLLTQDLTHFILSQLVKPAQDLMNKLKT